MTCARLGVGVSTPDMGRIFDIGCRQMWKVHGVLRYISRARLLDIVMTIKFKSKHALDTRRTKIYLSRLYLYLVLFVA
jgi:hypothetical protein